MNNPSVLNTLNIKNVSEYLCEVIEMCKGDDTLREYEEAIVNLIDRNNWSDEKIETIMENLMSDKNHDLAYAAFYALCTFYRRRQNIEEYGELLSRKRMNFRNVKSFAFLELMYRKIKTPDALNLIDEADYLCSNDMLGHNYGVQHCFSEYVAEACEKNISSAGFLVKKYLEKSIIRVNEALRLSRGYPKFYITRARLLVINAIYTNDNEQEVLFNLALKDIDTAVSTEKIVSKMIDYQIIGTRIQMMYYEQILSKNITKQETVLNEKIQDVNVKNLEFLGFFSAIIGLLLANIQLVQNLVFSQAATLIIVLTGCIITAFGALGFILHGTSERIKINSIIIALGLFLTIVALIYGGIYAM